MTDSSDELGRGMDAREPSSITSSLLTRVKAESPEAWRRLVGLFGPLVYQWCRQKGLQAATKLALESGRVLFPRLPLWRPPLDDLSA